MPADRPGQGEEGSNGNGHTERCKPITSMHSVPMAQGDDGKDDEQLGRDDRLDEAQTAHPESRHLKDEAEDHAGDPEKPYGPTEQVVDEVEPEAVLTRCRRRGPTLSDRGQRSEHARRKGEDHHLKLHDRASGRSGRDERHGRIGARTDLTYEINALRT